MESIWMKSSPEPDISVKNEKEFDVESEPYYIVMENQIEPDNMTEDKMKADVLDVQKVDVQVKSELENVIWIKNEPEADIKNEVEFEADLETEFEFCGGSKDDNCMVRILIKYNLKLPKIQDLLRGVLRLAS